MKPDNWTLVRGARQLLTLHNLRGPRRAGELASLGVIPDGSVLLRNGVIEAVGPTRRIENMADARQATEINAAGRVVMPAFIDCHACLMPVPANRCAAIKTGPSTDPALPVTRLETQTGDLLKTMAHHGAATIGALSGYGAGSARELKVLRAIRALDKKPLDIISILPVTGDADLHLLESVARRQLASLAHIRWGAPEATTRCGGRKATVPCTESEMVAAFSLARSLGFGLRLEIPSEHDTELVNTAVNAQALSISVTRPLTRPEIERLSYSSTFVIFLPAIPSPGAPCHARQLIEDGGLIALGTGITPQHDAPAGMQTVVQLACERLGLTIAEAISASTINAAWALGLGLHTGSLERGKLADLIVLNASDYRDIPLLAGTTLTYSMIKRGVVLFKEDFRDGLPSPDRMRP